MPGKPLLPVTQRAWARKRQKLLHHVLGGISAQPDKPAFDAVGHGPRALRLPDVVKLRRAEIAEDARSGEFAAAGIGLADDHLSQRTADSVLSALVFGREVARVFMECRLQNKCKRLP